MAFIVREARPEDGPALIELERLCPEIGRAAVRIEVQGNHFGLAARFPGSQGYVASPAGTSTIIGTIFSNTAPTQLNGRLLPAAYLFSLRVHPAHRRQGVASTLIAHACERALVGAGSDTYSTRCIGAGADTAWAAIIEGNDASLRTFEKAGFVRLRDLRAKILLGGLAWPNSLPRYVAYCKYRSLPHLSTRPASIADLLSMTAALNDYYASHNFWRPRTADQLRAELEALHHSVSDAEIAFTGNGSVVAAASALEVSRVARLRLLSLRALPGLINRLFAPVFGLLPLNILLVRHHVFPPAQPNVGAALILALHRRYLPRSWAGIVVADPLDPIWAGLDRLWGMTGHVHLVLKSKEHVDQGRPSYLP